METVIIWFFACNRWERRKEGKANKKYVGLLKAYSVCKNISYE